MTHDELVFIARRELELHGVHPPEGFETVTFDRLEIDSFAIVGLLLAVEAAVGTEIDDGVLESCTTLDELSRALVDRRLISG